MQEDGTTVYKGVVIDILNTLAEFLNFECAFFKTFFFSTTLEPELFYNPQCVFATD